MIQEVNTEKNVRGGQKKRRGFNLSTPMKARKRLARLASMRFKDEIDSQKHRDLTYAISKLLEYFKFENDLEIMKEIEAIKKQIGME